MPYPVAAARGKIYVLGSGAFDGYSEGEIGDVLNTTVAIRFSENIYSPTTDYKSGVTIKVNSVSRTINTATRQTDHHYVHYVIDIACDANDAITWEYDDDFGDMESEDSGNPLGDVTAETVDNWIGSHLYYNQADDCIWAGAL